MIEFFQTLPQSEVLMRALLAGIIASIGCGVIGSYVVARRITYIAGGIAHCTLGGMGAAGYAAAVWGLQPEPLIKVGAVAAALLAAIIIGIVSLKARQREDTVISALWAIGMAVGVLFIHKTPGYAPDLMNYLFGNILIVDVWDLVLMLVLDVVVVGLGLLFYNRFLAVCFDEEFARLRGVNVELYYLLLLVLTALTVVVLVQVVGLILVIALLALPAAIAGHFTQRLWRIMLIASLLSMLLTSGGLAISYGPELPAGATTIVLAGGLYLVTVVFARVIRPRHGGGVGAEG